jgi:XTP/dITP diphosphohydrolase
VRLVLATRNDHKLREFRRLLPQVRLEPLPPHVVLPPEDGSTYAANALVKARAAAAALGRPVIADDSGVEAAALGGAPGVHSARFAGDGASDADNLARLRAEAPAGSPLRYVCVIVYVGAGDTGLTGGAGETCFTGGAGETCFTGVCEGTLAPAPRGTGGFGYDPVFLPADVGNGRTMAELGAAEKDAISHRGRAARALQAWLEARAA